MLPQLYPGQPESYRERPVLVSGMTGVAVRCDPTWSWSDPACCAMLPELLRCATQLAYLTYRGRCQVLPESSPDIKTLSQMQARPLLGVGKVAFKLSGVI